MSSLYIFNSIWSFLGWLLSLVVFFTAVGSYRMNIQQLHSTQKRISSDEARNGAQVTPPMFGSRHLPHMNHHRLSLTERDNGDSVYNSDEEKEQHDVDREERLSEASFRGGSEHVKPHRRSNRSTGTSQRKGHSRYSSQSVELEQSLRERDRTAPDLDRDHLTLPPSNISARGIKSRTNHNNRGDDLSNHMNHGRRTKSLRSPLFPADDDSTMDVDDDSFIDTISEMGPQNDEVDEDFVDARSDIHLRFPSEHDFVDNGDGDNVDQYDDLLTQDIPDPMHDLEVQITPVMLPTPALAVFFEFSHIIREAWLTGVLRQQKFMLVRLIDGERCSSRISSLYAAVLQKLVAFYENEPVPAAGEESSASVDVLSVWQHELGDRKSEDSVDSNGQAVPWMCEIIKRVAAASAAVSGPLDELSFDSANLSEQYACATDHILTRLQALIEQPIPPLPVDDRYQDFQLPVTVMTSSAPSVTPDALVLPPPFDAREATLRYLTQSHTDRVVLTQHLCVNQQRRPAQSATGPSSPSTPLSSSALTTSLHPVYATSGVSARLLNVELMSDMEAIIAEIQANMEERLSATLVKWTTGTNVADNDTTVDDRLLQTPIPTSGSADHRSVNGSFSPSRSQHDQLSHSVPPPFNHVGFTARSHSAASAVDTTPVVSHKIMPRIHHRMPPLPPSARTPNSHPRSPTQQTSGPRPRHHRSQSLSEPH